MHICATYKLNIKILNFETQHMHEGWLVRLDSRSFRHIAGFIHNYIKIVYFIYMRVYGDETL